MTLKALIQNALALSVYCLSTSPFADEILNPSFSIESMNETVTAIRPDPSPVEDHEKNFIFDWNQQATITVSKNKLDGEEKFISTIHDISKLNQDDQQALGLLFYKLGTYYTHVAREPDLAIMKLTMANALLIDKQDKTWNFNHLAYAYEQKYALSNQADDKERALFYINRVISDAPLDEKNKSCALSTAFAYSIKGLLQNTTKDYSLAEASFKKALSLQEAAQDDKDDHYIRTKNRLANALLGQTGRDKEAIGLLKQIKQYWSSQGNLYQDPYAARNLISLSQAYLKTGNTKAACKELKTAIAIYTHVYGNHSTLLIKPYQLLAKAYEDLGNLSLAATYEEKADDMGNA